MLCRYVCVQECPLICPSFSWLYDEQTTSLWKISHQGKHDEERLPLMQVNQWYHDVCRHLGLLGRVLHILWRCKQTKLDHFDCFISIWSMGYKSKKYPEKQINWFYLLILSSKSFSVLNSPSSLSLYKRALQELWLQMEHNMVHLSSKDEINKWGWCLVGVE